MSDSKIVSLESYYGRGGQLRYKCPCIWPPAIPGKPGKRCEFDHYDPNTVLKHLHSTHQEDAEAAATRFNLFESDEDTGNGKGVEIIGERDFESAKRRSGV